MLSPNLKVAAQHCLNEQFTCAVNTDYFKNTHTKFIQPKLVYNQRGKIAASAHLLKNIIKIHPILFAQNSEYFYEHVIPHELAHILVHQYYHKRVKPHGQEWQDVMLKVFGLPPKVTHNLDVSGINANSFTYECDCNTVELSVIRHNKVLNNKQQYMCKRCKQVLRWRDG